MNFIIIERINRVIIFTIHSLITEDCAKKIQAKNQYNPNNHGFYAFEQHKNKTVWKCFSCNSE